MNSFQTLPAPAQSDSLSESMDTGGLSVINDLDPDRDIVNLNTDTIALSTTGDCNLELPPGKSNPRVIGGPHIDKPLDDGGEIEERLDELSKPRIEPPENGQFTKEYLFNVLIAYCRPIVEERTLFVISPGQHHHVKLRDPLALQMFLKKLLEVNGTADAATLRKQISDRKCKSIYTWLITDYKLAERSETFDNDGNYIAVANGIVHVFDGKIELLDYGKHPEMSFKHVINANYDTEAEHIAWDSFLSDHIGPKEKDLNRFWEAEGNLHFSNATPKKIVCYHGKGNDGKSVLAAVRHDIYAPNSAVFDGDLGQALSKFGTEAFKDAQILQLHETNTSININQTNKIKRITGGDRIMLDKKFCDLVTRKVNTKIVMICNHLPRFDIGAVDEALENRLLFIEVSAAPKEYRTESLKENLYRERDYYLTRAVQGYAALQANKYEFTKSKKDSLLKKTVFANNPAKAFLQDCCVTKDVSSDDHILGTDWKIVVNHWKVDIFEKFNYATLKNALVNLGYPYVKFTKGPDRDRYGFSGLRFNKHALAILGMYHEEKKITEGGETDA